MHGNVHDGLSKFFGCLLRKIVAGPARDESVFISAREFAFVISAGRMGGAIDVTFHGDRRHRDYGQSGKPLL